MGTCQWGSEEGGGKVKMTFSKQWGNHPSVRHIDGRAYHFQSSHREKSAAESEAFIYRTAGRLVRVFKRLIPSHVLKGSLKFRGKEEIVPEHTTYDVYATIKLRRK
jgi:hypothetical protein